MAWRNAVGWISNPTYRMSHILTSQVSDSPPFNLDEALARLGGQVDLFREMVEFFFGDGLKLKREIQEAAAAGDAAAMERKAHKLKGTVLYLGAAAATEAVAAVEALGRSGDLTGAAPAIDSMEKEMTRLAEALRSYRAVAPMEGGT